MAKTSKKADEKFSEDPRRKSVGDQLPEEQQEETIPGGGQKGAKGSQPRVPGKKRDSGPKIATGNRRAAGTK